MSKESSAVSLRPRSVVYACAFLVASFALAVVRSILAGGWQHPTSKVIGLCVLVAFTSLIVLAVYNRRNWVRWVCVVSIGGGLAILPWAIRDIASNTILAIHSAQAVLQGAAALLLIMPSANHWYSKAKQDA